MPAPPRPAPATTRRAALDRLVRGAPALVLVPLLGWLAPAGPAVAGPAALPVASTVSNFVACPDALAVDWAAPRLLTTSPAVTVRSYRARQQGGRTTTLTVAAAHPGRYRLVARGAGVVGRTATVAATTTAAGAAVLVGVNGGYFWRGTPGQEWSKGAQVRGGRVFYLPAGRSRYVGSDASGVLGAGWARTRGRVVVGATASGRSANLPVVAVNAPPAGDGVAVYTRSWSSAQPRRGGTWEVYVRKGVVVASAPRVAAVLAGSPAAEHRFVVRASGTALATLRRIRVGQSATFDARAVTDAGRVLTETTVGGTTLLVAGRVWTGCARVPIRPRTMVAWNSSTGALWLVTASGAAGQTRYGAFVGASHHQMALVAQALGATDAVLVDGGGSTTMVVRTPSGLRRVDVPFGAQRAVCDVLGIVGR